MFTTRFANAIVASHAKLSTVAMLRPALESTARFPRFQTPKAMGHRFTSSAQQPPPQQQPAPHPEPPLQPVQETPDQLYLRLKQQHNDQAVQAQRQFLLDEQRIKQSKPKTSPFTSFAFINLVFTLPAAIMTWKMYNDPVWIKLNLHALRSTWGKLRNPQFNALHAYNHSPLPVAIECNLAEIEILDSDDGETKRAKTEINETRMKQNIFAAQQVLFKEIDKAFDYIRWLDDFRSQLDEIMSIPGFVNNRQAEMQSRNMKANKAEIESFIQNLIINLIERLEKMESQHRFDSDNIVAEFKPRMVELLAEQERVRLIDEYKVESYKMNKAARAQNAHHTGMVMTPRIHKDAEGNAVSSDGERVDPNAERKGVLIDGTDDAILSQPFKPNLAPGMSEEQRQVEATMQMGLHRGERSLAVLGQKHVAQDEKIERMSAPGYESRRVVPYPLEVKPLEKYNDYELQLTCFLSIQAACVAAQTISVILESVMYELQSQRETIKAKKAAFEKQEHQREMFNNRRAKSVKDGNFFTDNTVPTGDNDVTGKDSVSQYDFVFDYEAFLELTAKDKLRAINDVVLFSLDDFWNQNTQYVHDRESLVKALELYPEAAAGLEQSTGLTAGQIYALPKQRIWIGRLISFPNCVVAGTQELLAIEDGDRSGVMFLGQDRLHPSPTLFTASPTSAV